MMDTLPINRISTILFLLEKNDVLVGAAPFFVFLCFCVIMSLCYYYVVVELDISIMSSEIAGYDRRRPYRHRLSNALSITDIIR